MLCNITVCETCFASYQRVKQTESQVSGTSGKNRSKINHGHHLGGRKQRFSKTLSAIINRIHGFSQEKARRVHDPITREETKS